MSFPQTQNQSVSRIEENLRRVKKLIKSPYVRPVDIVVRDRLSRQLRETQDTNS